MFAKVPVAVQSKLENMSEETSYKRPLSEDDIKRVMKIGLILSLSAIVFMLGFAVLVHYDAVKLYPETTKVESLKGFASRVEYALRYQTLLVFWLTFNILATIYGRITTKALNPLDEKTEEKVQLFKNILTNSFESIVVSIFSQLIFVSFAEPAVILKFIPLINIVTFIGRVAFFAGYPLKRAFGYHCTLVPNTILTIYNMVKLGSFLGIY